MKCPFIALIVASLAAAVGAAAFRPVVLPVADRFDTEVATNVSIAAWQPRAAWKNVTTGNFWSLDRIGCITIQDWEPGRLVWDIPIGWNRLGSLRGTLPVKNVGMFHATFDILMDGTVRVEKFGEWVSRGLSTNPDGPDNGKVFLNGEERNVQQDMARWLEELMQGDEVVL